MALAIFLSYGLQFYVPVNIIGPWFRNLFDGDFAQRISDVGLRTGLVIFTCNFLISSSTFEALYLTLAISGLFQFFWLQWSPIWDRSSRWSVLLVVQLWRSFSHRSLKLLHFGRTNWAKITGYYGRILESWCLVYSVLYSVPMQVLWKYWIHSRKHRYKTFIYCHFFVSI